MKGFPRPVAYVPSEESLNVDIGLMYPEEKNVYVRISSVSEIYNLSSILYICPEIDMALV